jgi:RteC protein
MQPFITKLNKDLNVQLQKIELEETNLIFKAQKSIVCLNSVLIKLRTFILNYTFKDEDEEIMFFKVIKPGIVSQLIYYVKINNIERKKPMGSIEKKQNHFRFELEKLTLFFNGHLEFYGYYRMNSTFLDDILFVKGREDIHFHIDNPLIYIDPDFSTSMDYMVAEIIANDRLEVFLKTELDALTINDSNPNWGQIGIQGNISLEWTDDKSSLVELIYALDAIGSLNNGKCNISILTAFFEQNFNVRLTDVYRTYIDIKGRDTPTKYLDKMRTALRHRMGTYPLKIIPLTLLFQSSIKFLCSIGTFLS